MTGTHDLLNYGESWTDAERVRKDSQGNRSAGLINPWDYRKLPHAPVLLHTSTNPGEEAGESRAVEVWGKGWRPCHAPTPNLNMRMICPLVANGSYTDDPVPDVTFRTKV